ncbi:hypothetical protein MICRO116_810041 [Micrococcus sp. 116]|nr:hypothetical protein MICRO116_810041 [Micrococcus sp. 116]
MSLKCQSVDVDPSHEQNEILCRTLIRFPSRSS